MTIKEFKEKADWYENELALLCDMEDSPEADKRWNEASKIFKELGDFGVINNLVTYKENGIRVVKGLPMQIKIYIKDWGLK
jgi:hypothetical protein